MKTSYEIISKIKELYDFKKNKDVAKYLRELNTLNIKGLDANLDIIEKMSEIFNILDDKNYKLGNIEKTKYIYASLPIEVQSRLTLDPNVIYQFYIKLWSYYIKKIIIIYIYISWTWLNPCGNISSVLSRIF